MTLSCFDYKTHNFNRRDNVTTLISMQTLVEQKNLTSNWQKGKLIFLTYFTEPFVKLQGFTKVSFFTFFFSFKKIDCKMKNQY